MDDGLEFSDDFGEILKHLSLVHPIWTTISRHTLGRILIFPVVTMHSAKAAVSTPIFGLWTREVYLPFSRYCGSYLGSHEIDIELCEYDSDVQLTTTLWNYVTEVLARTPNVLTLCIQTGAQCEFNIYRCVEKLSDVLPQAGLSRLRTLRLYSDIGNTGGRCGCTSISEIPSFFHALDHFPDFECLTLRHYLPCFRLSSDERIKKKRWYSGMLVGYEWLPDSPPDPYVVTRIVGDSSPLTGRIRSLADLVQSICNTPALVDDDCLMSIAHCTAFVAFRLKPGNEQFTINAAMIGDMEMKREIHALPPSLEYPKWCGDVEVFRLIGPYNIVERLSPFPSLKVLQILLTSSFRASPEKMRDEIRWLVESLPPSLELLSVLFSWECAFSEDGPLLPLEMHDELDELLSTIPTIRCPNIKVLQVEMDYVSKLFRKKYPLKRLIDTCEKWNIPLNLFPCKDPEYYGQCTSWFEIDFMVDSYVN